MCYGGVHSTAGNINEGTTSYRVTTAYGYNDATMVVDGVEGTLAQVRQISQPGGDPQQLLGDERRLLRINQRCITKPRR